MTNTFDYLDWRGDLSFSASPFCEVDMFICSQLSTPDYSGIVPKEGRPVPLCDVAEKYFSCHTEDVGSLGVLQSTSVLPMLRALAGTERYRNARLCGPENIVDLENEEQFCAVTVLLPDGTMCVSFRGTDDTIIAWKEDFNLATKPIVPAQIDARKYLVNAASAHRGKIRVCGHSKGGNLAVFAAASVPKRVRNRILQVVSFDGPGFSDAFLSSPGYLEIKDRIVTVLSQNSLVGTLLSTAGSTEIVHSCKSGPMAHDGFSWEVKGTEFVKEEALSETSLSFDRLMDETLSGLSTEEKQAFVDELFGTLLATGAETITDFMKLSKIEILETMKNLYSGKDVHNFTSAVIDRLVKDNADKVRANAEKVKAGISSAIRKQ